MRAPTDPYPGVLRAVMLARIAGDAAGALSLMETIRFEPVPRKPEKWPTRAVIAAKVILTPVMRLLARLYPEQFPYQASWKGDSTHPAFVSRSATLDHVVPIADGGDPLERSNLVTACWGCNRRKGDLRLDEIGWSLIEPADPCWMGLTDLYFPLRQAAGEPELGEDERLWLRGQPEQARSLSKAYKPYSSTMEFVLNGRTHSFDAETVRARVATVAADPIRTHWVEITVADGHQSRACIRRFGIR